MKHALCTWMAVAALSASAYPQPPDQAKLEFEVASIKPVEPLGFFHASGSGTGGPGSADAGMFRCTCTLSSLITKAFGLQRYQFPGQQAFSRDTFSVTAKVPEGATQQQFQLMLQNLLETRFGLQYHFDAKDLQGYQLVVAKNGPKLKQSVASSAPPANSEPHGDQHGGGHDGAFPWGNRRGVSFTMYQTRYEMDHQTSSQLAQILSNQLAKPVDDQTGLQGSYDILLTWSGDTAHDHGPVAEGRASGEFHGDHGGGGGAPGPGSSQTAPGMASGPTLFEAVQSQLGLKLIPARKTAAQIFVVDRINKVPTDN